VTALAWWWDSPRGVTRALLWGVLAPAAGTVSWIVPLRVTFHKGGNAFLGALIGGLAFRMILYGAILLVAGILGGVDLPVLMVVLFGSHLAYQTAEILAVHVGRRARETGRIRPPAPAVTLALVVLAAALAFPAPARATEQPVGEETHAEETHAEEAHAEEHGFDILHHVVDGHEMETPFGVIHLPQGWVVAGIDFAPTKHVVWIWIAAATVLVFIMVGVRSTGMVSRGLGNAIEAVVVFIRDEVAGKNIGHHPEKFTPYLCSLFFFILFCNLLGLVPFGATATGNLNVTAGLALLSLILIQGAGIRENGLLAHLKALCPIPEGVPGWLLPLYVPIIIAVEIVGIFAKPIALALRLFANMTAGHVVILSLIGLIFILESHLVAPISVAFALFIYCLEIFVGLVQAYIFTMLTALFIGMSQHPAH
jgi:F-type H+-transporting ATPase subunit a